jgi:hypothetical protein
MSYKTATKIAATMQIGHAMADLHGNGSVTSSLFQGHRDTVKDERGNIRG